MSRPLWFIKNCLIKDFEKWVAECPVTRKPACTDDVFEFLIQKGLLKGKHFNDYIDTLPMLDFRQYVELGSIQPLMEGYIPPRTWFGRKCKEKKTVAKTESTEKEVKRMKITYTLKEADIKKLLADHFETEPEDITIRDLDPNLNCTDVEITVVQYPD